MLCGYAILPSSREMEMEIELRLDQKCWTATFWGGIMPQGQAIPLPYTADVPYQVVSEDMHRRFQDAWIRYR